MKSILLAFLILLIAAPVLAQDETPPIFSTTRFQCDMGGLDALIERNRERAFPIMQALVNEGVILSAGMARHQWGDEYNLLTWVSGADMASTLAGEEALNARYNEMYPDDRLFGETCPTHRDNFSTRQLWSAGETPRVIDPENPPTLAISHYTCDYSALADIVANYREKAMPISQALVNEGAMGSEGVYTHAWGDEWNLIITRTAANMGALDSALDTFGERFQAEHGEDAPNMIEEHCSAHKDNIYWMVMSTN